MEQQTKDIWLYSLFGILAGLAVVGVVIKRKDIKEWAMPLLGRISSPFGNRINPVTNEPQFHNGVDIASPNGTPIKAPYTGVAEKVWTDELNGNGIRLKHDNGYVTGYAHLSKQLIKVGDKVKVGQVIGEVGSTGRSTGNHLHFTMQKPDEKGKLIWIDPLKEMKGKVV